MSKGKSYINSGYVYAPYVPMQVSPRIRRNFEYIALTKENINKFIAMHFILDSVQIKMYHRVSNPLLRKRLYHGTDIQWYSEYYPREIKGTLNWMKSVK